MPVDLPASSGFLGLYSETVAVGAALLLDEDEATCAGDEDSRRRDGLVRFGVMTVRGPAAGDIEDTEKEGLDELRLSMMDGGSAELYYVQIRWLNSRNSFFSPALPLSQTLLTPGQ